MNKNYIKKNYFKVEELELRTEKIQIDDTQFFPKKTYLVSVQQVILSFCRCNRKEVRNIIPEYLVSEFFKHSVFQWICHP